MNINFYYNGIKVNGGNLIKCHYALDSNANNAPMVTIMCRDFCDKLPSALNPKNSTDITTDYVEPDCARLTPENPYYSEARKAAIKETIRNAKRSVEFYEKKLAENTRHSDLYQSEIDFYNGIIKRYA